MLREGHTQILCRNHILNKNKTIKRRNVLKSAVSPLGSLSKLDDAVFGSVTRVRENSVTFKTITTNSSGICEIKFNVSIIITFDS